MTLAPHLNNDREWYCAAHGTYRCADPTCQEISNPGVKEIEAMSDREILVEILTHMRAVGAALGELQKVGVGGMLKMMMSSKGK